MDAREQLRRYLEQRKESGETEVVLDQLGVDEVLRLVGAGESVKPRGSGVPAASPTSRPAEPAPSADWRETLRQSGAAPEKAAPAPPPAPAS